MEKDIYHKVFFRTKLNNFQLVRIVITSQFVLLWIDTCPIEKLKYLQKFDHNSVRRNEKKIWSRLACVKPNRMLEKSKEAL